MADVFIKLTFPNLLVTATELEIGWEALLTHLLAKARIKGG